MDYRKCGTTALETSVLGLGTWEIGNRAYGQTDEAEAVAAIQHALELGVTCFDTAPAYGFGRSEEVLGQALGTRRRDVILVSKCGLTWREHDDTADWWRDSSRPRVMEEIDITLRRLGTDWVDFYLVHWPDGKTPIAETAQAMADIVQAGKARYVGVSNFSLDQIQEFAAVCPLSVVQMGYNLFDRRIEEHILPYCREHGIAVMGYGALCYGLLTGTFTTETRFDPPDWRAGGKAFGLELFTPENFPRNVAVVDRLKSLAARLEKTLPQVALNWMLYQPGITIGLSGVRHPREIADNVGATGWRLAADDLAEIDLIFTDAAGTTGPLPVW